jgi:DNA-directed RNA polymerase specialized sigma24 family protein
VEGKGAEPADGPGQVIWADREHDTDVVAALFGEHHLELVRLALVMVGDLATAEDVVQDAFERLHRRRNGLRDEGDGLLRYARSAVLNRCRSLHRRAVVARRHAPALAGPAAAYPDTAAQAAEREVLIAALRSLPQGRLVKDEFDVRVGQTLAARTYADLAALTADLPAGPAAPEPAAKPASTPARTLAKAVRRSGICMLIAFALVGFVALTHAETLAPLAFFPGIAAIIAASGFLGYGVVDAWQERRSRGQLPPRPAQRRRALEGEQNHRRGDDLILCQAHSDARAHHLPGHRAAQRARRSRTVRRGRGRLAILRLTA